MPLLSQVDRFVRKQELNQHRIRCKTGHEPEPVESFAMPYPLSCIVLKVRKSRTAEWKQKAAKPMNLHRTLKTSYCKQCD